MFARAYNCLEKNPQWLEAARLGAEFIMKRCFDKDGRMYFRLTEDGRPLYKPWAIFGETFAAIGLAEYAKASGDKRAAGFARKVYRRTVDWVRHPEKLPHHGYPATRPAVTHAVPMIMLNTTQVMREALAKGGAGKEYDAFARECLDKIINLFYKPEDGVLLETVAPDGSRLDTPEGRCVNPGHMLESAWFVMHEGERLRDEKVIAAGAAIARHAMRWGWDDQHGGIFYFVDAAGKPPSQLEWDMKLWWPHTEALYALLLAAHLTGEAHFQDWHRKVHDYTFRHFPDREGGEWFGYLHRDGQPSHHLKGSIFKGPYHIPRALLLCIKLLEKVVGSK